LQYPGHHAGGAWTVMISTDLDRPPSALLAFRFFLS